MKLIFFRNIHPVSKIKNNLFFKSFCILYPRKNIFEIYSRIECNYGIKQTLIQ